MDKMEIVEQIEQFRNALQLIVESELGYIIFLFGGILLIMLVDILTGFSQAKINRKIASHRMSDGLLKKFNIIMVLTVLTFLSVLLPKTLGNTIIIVIYIYEYLNELISISENLIKMNVNINFLNPILNVIKKYLKEYENESNNED